MEFHILEFVAHRGQLLEAGNADTDTVIFFRLISHNKKLFILGVFDDIETIYMGMLFAQKLVIPFFFWVTHLTDKFAVQIEEVILNFVILI